MFPMKPATDCPLEGILLVDKPKGITSFSLVSRLRRLTSVKKIGHAGTLDPLATGVMVMLIGKSYTKQSNALLGCDKEYEAIIKLGSSTDSYDAEGCITQESTTVPTCEEVNKTIEKFQGEIEQIPPMFSAKKIGGKKLYQLARKGIEVKRPAQKVHLATQLLDYSYPYLKLKVSCSKGTYIRSLAHDIGQVLGSFAHLFELKRTKSGSFSLGECHLLEDIEKNPLSLIHLLKK